MMAGAMQNAQADPQGAQPNAAKRPRKRPQQHAIQHAQSVSTGGKLVRDLTDFISQTETEKARLEDEKARLEDEKARLEAEKARLEDDNARLEDDNAGLKDDNAGLMSDVLRFSTTLKEQSTKLRAYEQQSGADGETIMQLTEKVREWHQKFTEVKEELQKYYCCSACHGDDILVKDRVYCQRGHYICSDCTTGRLNSALSEGCLVDIHQCTLCENKLDAGDIMAKVGKDLYSKYLAGRSLREQPQVPAGQGFDFTNLHLNYTPCCKLGFMNFDACCAVACGQCETYFCAFCFGTNDGGMKDSSSVNMHDHVRNCPNNPRDDPEADAVYATTRLQKLTVRLAALEHARHVLNPQAEERITAPDTGAFPEISPYSACN